MIRCNAVAPIDGEIRCEGPVDHEGHHRADVFAAAVGPSGPEVYHRVSWPRADEPTRVHTADLRGIRHETGPISAGVLGVTPRRVWLEHRARDLAEAISRHLAHTSETGDRPDAATLRAWAAELDGVLFELEAPDA